MSSPTFAILCKALWLILLPASSQGHIFPCLAGTARMQGEAKLCLSCCSRWVFGYMNKSVGMGIPDSCTCPNNFLALRAVYPPAKEIKQTRECCGTVLVPQQTVYCHTHCWDALRPQLLDILGFTWSAPPMMVLIPVQHITVCSLQNHHVYWLVWS